jgi:hypothetical protein
MQIIKEGGFETRNEHMPVVVVDSGADRSNTPVKEVMQVEEDVVRSHAVNIYHLSPLKLMYHITRLTWGTNPCHPLEHPHTNEDSRFDGCQF